MSSQVSQDTEVRRIVSGGAARIVLLRTKNVFGDSVEVEEMGVGSISGPAPPKYLRQTAETFERAAEVAEEMVSKSMADLMEEDCCG